MQPPERLQGDGVALRRMTDADVLAYAAAFHDDPSLASAVGYDNDPNEAWVRDRLASAVELGGFELVIAGGAEDRLRGMVAVHHIHSDHGRAEIGFWLAPAERGSGLAARAVALLIDWLFADGGLRRVEMSTIPENGGVLALARRLGFAEEGVQRQRDIERGRPVDIVWFGLLRDEWPASATRR